MSIYDVVDCCWGRCGARCCNVSGYSIMSKGSTVIWCCARCGNLSGYSIDSNGDCDDGKMYLLWCQWLFNHVEGLQCDDGMAYFLAG